MRQATLYRYTLPFHSGLILKDQVLNTRSGLFVCLKENGQEGWGEIAPLPTFSQENLAQAEKETREWLSAWLSNKTLPFDTFSPSVAFGLSMAECELHHGVTPIKTFRPVTLCSDSSKETIEKLRHQTVAKLKIGRNSPKQDGQNAASLFTTLPNLRLRLDANRAWSFNDAVEFAESIPVSFRSRIEFIEEPCHTPEQSLQFAQAYGIAIAWDESTREANFLVKKQPNLTAIILKPTLIGSVQKCVVLIQQAQANGLKCVISSSLESSLGLTQLAQLATKHTPNSPAGLDTLHLMPCQLLRGLGDSNLPLQGLNSAFITQLL